MSDHDALLRAIVENPDEDTPRLVFADWLDEHADALPVPAAAHSHAAFVRDDVATARRNEFDPLRLRWELIEKPRRESEPWANRALARLPEGATFDADPLFRRGFAWSVLLNTLGTALPEPPADTVPLERIRYRHCGHPGIDQLRAAPWRSRLRAIEFERGITTPIRSSRLLAVDGLDRLERLAFVHDAVTAAEARELITAPLFGQLSALTVTRAPVGGAVVHELVRTGRNTLRELHLVACRLNAVAVAELLAAPAAAALEALSLGGERIGSPQKFVAFRHCPPAPALRSLDLSDEAPNAAAVETLLASPLVPGLRRLDLSRCSLNRDRTRLLAGGAFDNLRVLRLYGNSAGNEGVISLARSPRLAGLLVLDLGFTQVGDEGIEAILESPLADGLVFLDVTGSPASEEMKEELVGRMGDRVRV